MSRSRRKSPVSGVAPSPSEKEWKQHSSRSQRRGETVALASAGEDDPDLPSKRAQDHWGPKDGKYRFDPAQQPKRMRK
jgi:hypothetical protein